ncbi:MAG: isoprenoid biosynthesis glyoxalase ElbB [Nitrospira sp.]|nr:isoprenoid biosynthesis glyoxalase ElbB [Candidatus Manganitrophaceae bacterium]HIL35397.1 isoprenoid biosynthesis glyoxalase ElbB [Candidatus Manganitrophaceae bacterium]
MRRKIGVVLSGCGHLDGAEIQETVVTLLAIDRAGAEAVCMAPDIDQMHVIDHRTGKEMSDKRNVLIESARIARGNIQDLKGVDPAGLDALILPGGYGAAKNLCDFAVKEENCQVDPDVGKLVRSILDARKPIGVICIAPALMAKVAQGKGELVKLTIGNDGETAAALQKMGTEHVDTKVEDIVVDEVHRIVSTPAYMLGKRISEVAEGIEKLVKKVVNMI